MTDTTITGSISTGLTLHGTLGASSEAPTGTVVTGNEISGQMVGGPKGETGPKGDPGTTDYNELQNLPDLTLKVDKVATVNTLYGVNGSGNQASYLISQGSDTSSIAQRSSGGTLTVGTPTASAHATTKAYVDTEVSTLDSSLATVAKTGSYNDLSNKPAIPSIAGLATETYVNNAVAPKANTSDLGTAAFEDVEDLPVSTAQQTALDGKADLINGKVPEAQLPSFVDDVLSFNSQANFPATGEDGKIYIAKDTNLTYRWTGSAYTEISQSLALGETASTAYRGDRGKTAYDHTLNTNNPHGVTKAQVGLSNVDNTSDADKPVSTAQQTALNAKQDTLVSGTNIKTINGTSLLGSGDITISGGGHTPVWLATSVNSFFIPVSGFRTVGYTSMTQAGGWVHSGGGLFVVPVSGNYVCSCAIRRPDSAGDAARGVYMNTSLATEGDVPTGVWFSDTTVMRQGWTQTRTAHFNAGDTIRHVIYYDRAGMSFKYASLSVSLLSAD